MGNVSDLLGYVWVGNIGSGLDKLDNKCLLFDSTKWFTKKTYRVQEKTLSNVNLYFELNHSI